MRLTFLPVLFVVALYSQVFSQQSGYVACDKFSINKISNSPIFSDMLDIEVTNSDTTYWVFARIDVLSLNGDTLASAPSCGCSLLAGGGTETLNIFVEKPFIVPADFSCYVVVGNAYPSPCRKLYKSGGQSDVQTVSKNTADIHFYPNPAKNNLTVDLSFATGTTTHTLAIVNLQGQRVAEQAIASAKTQVDVSALNAGIYFVQLYTNNSLSTTKKLVIE